MEAWLPPGGSLAVSLQRKVAVQVVNEPHAGAVNIEALMVDEPQRAVIAGWNVSHFLAKVIELEDALDMVGDLVVRLRGQLMAGLPDFPRDLT